MGRRHISLLVGTLALGIPLAATAAATLRWRTDGHECSFTGTAGANVVWGPHLGGGSSASATCSVPLGPDLADYVPGSPHAFTYVALRYTTRGTGETWVYQELVTHDSNTDDYCVCDADSGWKAPGNQLTYLDFAGDADSAGCDLCPGGPVPSHWVANVYSSFYRATTPVDASIKRIAVFE